MIYSKRTNKFNLLEKLAIYLSYRNDPLNTKAVFSDETSKFRSPLEPLTGDDVLIKIRTAAGNADEVNIVLDHQKIPMEFFETDGVFDYYVYKITKIFNKVEYFFEIIKGIDTFFYNKCGISTNNDSNFNFSVTPDFKTPDWAKGAVMYQIYVDRFFNGNKQNDVVSNEYIYLSKPSQKIDDWHKIPSTDDIRNFYGGDLQGIIQKLSYLKDLGIEAIYLNPIFVSPSNHKYDIQDYDYVDPHLGVIVEDGGEALSPTRFHNKYASMYVQRTTNIKNLEASNQVFIELVEAAHANGIKVIIDGVFNHCGAFNKWLDRENFYHGHTGYVAGAYKDKNSPYVNYFKWYDKDNWPNNDCYDGWWGYDNHPKLNFEASPDLYNYIMQLAKKWVSPPFNADGWRLDVAADLGSSSEFNHKFWKDFRKAVKEANPQAIIVAEHYGDAKDWLKGDEWDTVMNYDAFMEPITWFLTGMEKHSDEFRSDLLCNGGAFEAAMKYHMSRLSGQSLYTAMNELSNHDHSRFLTRTNMTAGRLHTKGAEAASIGINTGIMREAVVFQMTCVGAPTVYYGDEAGVAGWTDPDNRRTYPWDREDGDMIEFHKIMINIHKTNTCLRTGSFEYLYIDHGIICFGRFDDNSKIVTVLNNNGEYKMIKIPVWRIGVALSSKMERLITSDRYNYYTESGEIETVTNGHLTAGIPAYGSVVFKER